MKEIRWLTYEEMLECDDYIKAGIKLNNILKYASNNISFYKGLRLSKQEKLSILDFPIIEKQTLRDNYEELKGENLTGSVFEVKTTGSTGKPIKTMWTNKEYNISTMEVWNARKQFGADIRDAVIYFLGLPDGHNTDEYKIIKKGNTYEITRVFTSKAVNAYLDLIDSLKGVILYGSPSSLYRFAKAIKKFGLVPPSKVKCIELNGEMLSDEELLVIKDVFAIPILNNYGCREMWPIALTCRHGTMHVRNDVVWLETTESKEILVTSLIKKAQPLVRYMVGDLGEISYGKCPCGLHSQIITKLIGRKNDYIYINGTKRVHWAVLTRPITDYVLENGNVIDEYFIHQKADMSIDINIVPGESFNETVAIDIKKKILEKYPELTIQLCLCDSIKQNNRGKRIYLQCDVKNIKGESYESSDSANDSRKQN